MRIFTLFQKPVTLPNWPAGDQRPISRIIGNPSIQIWLLLVVIVSVLPPSNTITWLGLHRYHREADVETTRFSAMECALVSRNHGLMTKRQQRFCRHAERGFAMHGVLTAAKAAVFYCMLTFQSRRWNCSSAERLPSVSPDLQIGTQEQAVVHAFSSAALMFEVARRCASGRLRHCSCGTTRSGWMRSPRLVAGISCADNVAVGAHYTRKFTGCLRMGRLKNRRRRKKKRKQQQQQQRRVPHFLLQRRQAAASKRRRLKRVNGHNYEAGIQTQLGLLFTLCTCVGQSTSCSSKVCYRRIRRMDDEKLLESLRSLYLSAHLVEVDSEGRIVIENPLARGSSIASSSGSGSGSDSSISSSMRSLSEPIFVTTATTRSRPVPVQLSVTELAFLEHSPDYCEPDPDSGSLGTHGRECKLDGEHVASTAHCSNMCCGREFSSAMKTQMVQCGCRLTQTYNITCDSCSQRLRQYFCL